MNKYLATIILISTLFTACSYDQDDFVNTAIDINSVEVIRQDAELYENIKGIINDTERPDQSIACIDFIYPLTLYIFDDMDLYQETYYVTDDETFSTLLDDLETDHSISISFPISSTLESGEEFTINTTEELKDAIDNCLNEEMLQECFVLVESCFWKIGYSYNYDNTYLGHYFYENDGATILTIDEEEILGSWSPLIIENELHININLIDDEEIGAFFNHDWKVDYIDENSLLLTYENLELVLNQRCDETFTECGNFNFEACETELDSGIGEFILDDHTFCIFDTLELDLEDENFTITYYESEEDALDMVNPIVSEDIYTVSELEQTIYVTIIDIENELQYDVVTTLSVINCEE
ncbi:hypothetical protein ACU8DI_01110 [Psychroserpens sp. BH13MA-6]